MARSGVALLRLLLLLIALSRLAIPAQTVTARGSV